MNKNIVGDILSKFNLLPIAAVTASFQSTGVDVSQIEGQLALFLDGSNVAGSSPTMALKLQHSDTQGGTYTDVTGGGFTGLTTGAGSQKLVVDADGLKKWVRIDGVIGGTSSPQYLLSCQAYGIPKYPA